MGAQQKAEALCVSSGFSQCGTSRSSPHFETIAVRQPAPDFVPPSVVIEVPGWRHDSQHHATFVAECREAILHEHLTTGILFAAPSWSPAAGLAPANA